MRRWPLLAFLLLAIACQPLFASGQTEAQPLPSPAATIPDAIDEFLNRFQSRLDELEAAEAAQLLPRLSALMELVRTGPESAAGAIQFKRAQRLRMDALVSRMADLQITPSAAPSASAAKTLDALMEGNTGKIRYDQVLERFARQLDTYETAIAAGDRASYAAIGLLLQSDARAIIAVGSNGSVAQRNRAMILSGRYADLSSRAALARRK